MGNGLNGDTAAVSAQYNRQTFQMSYSDLQLRSQQRQAAHRDEQPHSAPSSNVFLSNDAQNALESAKKAVSIGRGFNKKDVAERTARGMSDFVHRLHDLLGAKDDPHARGRFSQNIGDLVSERARKMGQGLIDSATDPQLSFTDLQLSVSIESFDLRIKTAEGETNLSIERMSLSLSVTTFSASIGTRDNLIIGNDPQSDHQNDQRSADDPELAGKMDAITQLFDRMIGVGSISRPGPANLLRIFTDQPLIGGDTGGPASLGEPDKTDVSV